MKTVSYLRHSLKSQFFIIIILLLLTNILSYEDNEGRVKRYKFYKDIQKFSNNTMTVGVDPFNGLYCQANEFISNSQKTLKVPKDHAMCPYYIFPFKFEIVEFLNSIKGLTDTIGREQKFSVFVLVYNILYHLYANKEFLKEYIDKNNLIMYQNLEFDVIDNIENSFPKIILGKSTLEPDHFKLLNDKKLSSESSEELGYVFKSVLYRISQHPHMEAMFHWTSNFDHFRHAYGVVMSRGMTLRLNEYYTLVDNKRRQSFYKDYEKKNLEINQRICKATGCPCIVLYIDLCNHYQPKYRDLRDKRPIILDTEVGYFISAATREYDIYEEVSYTYSNDSNNLVMFLHYGFVIPDNIFNSFKLDVNEDIKLSQQQFQLCTELKCFEGVQMTEPSKIPAMKIYTTTFNILNENLINYARIRSLKAGSFNTQNVLKSIRSNKSISFENELSSWVFYLQQLRKKWNGWNKKQFIESIKNGQIYRNRRRDIEREWRDEESQRAQWRDLRHFDLIYDLDISYKRIILNHLVGSGKKLIKTIHDDIVNNFRSKYVSAN